LFYYLITKMIAEMAPVIYTPTVGYACQNMSTLFRRPRGMYFTANDRGDMQAIIQVSVQEGF
jgi:malic enzyme